MNMAEENHSESAVRLKEESMNTEDEDTIHYVGERNAIVFSADSGEPLPAVEELPDDFFKLNKDDIKLLYKEMKQKRDDLENMPLRTKAVREMETSAVALSNLRRYTRTVLRVQFPDRLVLQAVFNHSDTVQTVIDFVRNFLDPSHLQFYLYTAPPKSILKPEMTLLDSKLTPRALLYFGTSASEESKSYIKSSFTTTLTLPALASQAALQYRKEDIEEVKEERPVKEDTASPSTSQKSSKPSTSKRAAGPNTKVPKWFRP